MTEKCNEEVKELEYSVEEDICEILKRKRMTSEEIDRLIED